MSTSNRFGGPIKTLVGPGPVQSTTTYDTQPTTTIPITSSAAFTQEAYGLSFIGSFGEPLQDVGHQSEQNVHDRKVRPPFFSSRESTNHSSVYICDSVRCVETETHLGGGLGSMSNNHKLSSIQEHIGADIKGIYTCNHRHSSTALCLEELVLPSSEQTPPKEVAPVADADMWQQLNISEHYASKDTICATICPTMLN